MRVSAMARKTTKGRTRDTPPYDAATGRGLRKRSSFFSPKQLCEARFVEAHVQRLLLRDRHAAGGGAARFAHVLAAGPRHPDPGPAAEGGELRAGPPPHPPPSPLPPPPPPRHP